MIHISDVKYVLPADNVISKLPDYTNMKSKQYLNPDQYQICTGYYQLVPILSYWIHQFL